MSVIIKTELGDIKLELYPDQAPITVANFLQYVRDNAYENASFYRMVSPANRADNWVPTTIDISVIQGGLGMDAHPKKRVPIVHETTQQTGLRHVDGAISMGRYDPGTAHSEFFICVGDQPELDFAGKRNPDGQGFAAFGQVIMGMEVVKKIHGSPAKGQTLEPPIKIFSVEVSS